MTDSRDRIRDRDNNAYRERDDRDRDSYRDRRKRDRDDRSKRSHTPDRTRSRHARSRSRSPDHRRRSRSPDRSRRHRTPSPDRKRRKRSESRDRRRDVVSDFVDGIAKDQKKPPKNDAVSNKNKNNEESNGGENVEMMDADEVEMMKMMGIPSGFDSTKGKPVPGNDVSGIRAVTKRMPRQYMNRRGGFNRPLPAERNR